MSKVLNAALSIGAGACRIFAIAMALAAIAAPLAAAAAAPVNVSAGNVEARVTLSAAHSSGGGKLAYVVDFAVAPGWHIYGAPLPEGEGLTPTSIKFDGDLVAQQRLDLPQPLQLHFAALNQTYPVYQGTFKGTGNIVLAPGLKPGDYSIGGTLNFQECNDAICKMPQAVRFTIPLKID